MTTMNIFFKFIFSLLFGLLVFYGVGRGFNSLDALTGWISKWSVASDQAGKIYERHYGYDGKDILVVMY
jgi:hypothetical protein